MRRYEREKDDWGRREEVIDDREDKICSWLVMYRKRRDIGGISRPAYSQNIFQCTHITLFLLIIFSFISLLYRMLLSVTLTVNFELTDIVISVSHFGSYATAIASWYVVVMENELIKKFHHFSKIAANKIEERKNVCNKEGTISNWRIDCQEEGTRESRNKGIWSLSYLF